jgi:CRP-like cAMP-binding protein
VESGLLADVPEDVRRDLLTNGRRRSFSRGEVVFHRDDPADAMHLVRQGRFAVQITTPLGDTAILALVRPGESFGEAALLPPYAPRSATVFALDECETLSLHRLDFDRMRTVEPAVNDLLLSLYTDKVRHLSDQLVQALYLPADKRLRRRLCELVDGAVEGDVPLTQEQLASLAGTSRATVNKVLREEQRRGTVVLTRGRTRVTDRPALEARAR